MSIFADNSVKSFARISVLAIGLLSAKALFAHNPDSLLVKPDSASVAIKLRLDSMIRYAVTFLGTNYCMGGEGDECFDCSGFVSAIYNSYGFDLPRTSCDIATKGKAVKRADIQPGDIIYFKGRNSKSKKVGHVGIVVQNDGHTVTFIHASVYRGICFDDTDTDYYKRRYLGARRMY